MATAASNSIALVRRCSPADAILAAAMNVQSYALCRQVSFKMGPASTIHYP
jgi:hypothetical protein